MTTSGDDGQLPRTWTWHTTVVALGFVAWWVFVFWAAGGR
jgi:hypothetical protein